MRKKIAVLLPVFLVTFFGWACGSATGPTFDDDSAALANGGRDETGLNLKARQFNGIADGADGVLDGLFNGDPTFANDHLVIKWNKEYQRGIDENWSDPNGYPGARFMNKWNGRVPNGSGTVWLYKVEPFGGFCGPTGTLIPGGSGAYCLNGIFMVVFSHGTVAGDHFWEVHPKLTAGLFSSS